MDPFARFPRTALAHLPTPLEPCPGVSRWLDGPEIWVKRDDQTGLAGGGNKARKLEFLMADALARGVDEVLTAGSIQSNHVRQTAAAAAKLGLGCHVLLEDPSGPMAPEFYRSGNVFLDRLLRAEIRRVAAGTAIEAGLQCWSEELARDGARPYVIPVGGSNPVGALGYALCAREILEQVRSWPAPPAALVLATGSAGTQAGLLVGLFLEQVAVPVIGVCVSRSSEAQERMVERLANQLLALLGYRTTLPGSLVLTHDGEVGAGYGLPTPGMAEAVREAAAREGLLLDPVYTGKALAGLAALCRDGQFHPSERVIFLHTGGWPALYAYPALVPEERS